MVVVVVIWSSYKICELISYSGRTLNFLVVSMKFVLVHLIQPNETFLSKCWNDVIYARNGQ